MTNNIEPDPPVKKMPKFPIIVLALIGMGVTAYILFGIYYLLNPDLLASTKGPVIPSASEPLLVEEGSALPIPSKKAQKLLKDSAQWNAALDESFDTNINSWTMGAADTQDMNSLLELKDGKYLWEITSKNTILAGLYPYALEPTTDFRLSADVKLTGGTYKPVYGVVFRDNPNGNGYYFGIYGENFVVEKRYNETFVRIIEYIKSPAISPQETNRLTVIAKGAHFVFLINDQFVGEMFDDSIKEGSVGFGVTFYHVDLQNSFEFDNFVLRTP